MKSYCLERWTFMLVPNAPVGSVIRTTRFKTKVAFKACVVETNCHIPEIASAIE